MEIVWLFIGAFSLFLAIYNTIYKSGKDSFIFFVFVFISIFMFLLRRYYSENN